MLAALLLTAQAPVASVGGVVSDAGTGAPIAGVMIAISNPDRTGLSDSAGRYRLLNVPPGWHQLTTRLIGYRSRAIRVLVPAAGALELGLALEPDPVPIPDIEIHASRVDPGSAVTPGTSELLGTRRISAAEVRSHPLLAEPDYFAAISGGILSTAAESPTGLHLAGGSSDQLAYQLDGIPVFNPYHAAGVFSAWNPDALARLELTSDPTAGTPDGLGGTMEGHLLPAGDRWALAGAATASQARLTVGGPLSGGAGLQLGGRSGFAGLAGHQSDPTYLAGHNRDWIGTVSIPTPGGRLALIGYENRDALGAGSDSVLLSDAPAGPLGHRFFWRSRSLGIAWDGVLGRSVLKVRGWSAETRAAARWIGRTAAEELESSRQDYGFSALIRLPGSGQQTTAGLRAVTSRSDYRLFDAVTDEPELALRDRTPVLTLSAAHQHRILPALGVQAGLSLSRAGMRTVWAPSGAVFWQPDSSLGVAVSYIRTHQFSQSLKNPESPVAAVFPVDLWVGGWMARGGLARVSLVYRPIPSLGLTGELYHRSTDDVAAVAEHEGGPFALTTVGRARSTSYGGSVQLRAEQPAFVLQARYTLQRTVMRSAGQSYRPSAAVPHTVEIGAIARPVRRASVRLSATGLFGRRATLVTGPFEWEGCNLWDRGCEFAGAPVLAGPLGGLTLPAYFRIDLGVRYDLPVAVLGRSGTLGVFGSFTNLLDRSNQLTSTVDPSSGRVKRVTMRPRSPLVAGLDWRF
jgi:hypothetical protein